MVIQLARPADTTKSLIYQVEGVVGGAGDTLDYTMYALSEIASQGAKSGVKALAFTFCLMILTLFCGFSINFSNAHPA